MVNNEIFKMTPQEAITEIDNEIAREQFSMLSLDREKPYSKEIIALEMANQALEKQIPKKCETNLSYPEDKYCPNCLENFTGVDCTTYSGENFKYCPSCGQAIDWGEDTE